MKCFVTGASGFIGANLVHELNARGHAVKGLLRPNAGGMGLPKSGAEWFFKSAAAIEKAAKDIKITAPAGLGTARTTELYYLVDVLDLPAYSSPQI